MPDDCLCRTAAVVRARGSALCGIHVGELSRMFGVAMSQAVQMPPASVRAPRDLKRRCRTWAAEGAWRMLQNTLDAEVAEAPDELIVYGGRGRAARNWDCYHAMLRTLEGLGPEET